jgi:hypothetical protein
LKALRLRERNQIKGLINMIRNSGDQEDGVIPARISKMMAIFFGKSLQIMMNPQHILYEKVNSFFLQRPALELDDVPMFYTLANSGEYFEEEVDWLMDILIAGLDDDAVRSGGVLTNARSLHPLGEDMSWNSFWDCTGRELGSTSSEGLVFHVDYRSF